MGGVVYRKDKQGIPCPDFRNDLNKTRTLRKKRKKESLCNEIYRNVSGSSAFTAIASEST